jgi:hypothetical protein
VRSWEPLRVERRDMLPTLGAGDEFGLCFCKNNTQITTHRKYNLAKKHSFPPYTTLYNFNLPGLTERTTQ